MSQAEAGSLDIDPGPAADTLKRMPPHNDTAEQAVLGAILMNRDVIADVSAVLDKSDFYNPRYGVVYEGMLALYNEGQAIDLLLLSEKLKNMGADEAIYKLEFMGEVIASVPSAVSAVNYAKIVSGDSMRRKLIKLSDEIANSCYMGKDTVDELLESAEQKLFKLSQSNQSSDGLVGVKDVVMDVLDRIYKASKTTSRITGVPTGFAPLDYKLSGLHGSELILIAARPAMGKTAFALNIAQNVVSKSKIPVAIFSLEMPKEQLVSRMVAMDSLVDSQNIRTGQLDGSEWKSVMDSAVMIGETPLFINDNSSITIPELRSICTRWKSKHGLGLIIIDYLQLMNGNRKRSDSRQNEISEISRALKILSRDLDVPVIALSQLSRAVESRDDKKPMLSDLRESGAIEQDADVVMFIYREDYYLKEESKRKGIADIIIAKQRNGSTGTVELVWLGKYTKFAVPERPKEQA
ncbi:MAG: replicative DNA helicase [Lachnospiraceae bacterium]|nr:replicative DNA helicase [Lachnospiraceae bacterium]